MDPELNGTSFASVACSESDGGGVCHLCVAALEQGLGCGWCHDIARCTKRTQCQVSFVNSETQVLFEIFQCSKEQGVRTVRFHQTFPSSSLLNSASASIGKFPKPMVCDGGLTETRTSRNSFTLYSTRLATVSNPPRPSSTCSGTITSSFHRTSRPDLGGSRSGVAFNPTPPSTRSTLLRMASLPPFDSSCCFREWRRGQRSVRDNGALHSLVWSAANDGPSLPPGNPPFRSLKVVVIVHSHLLFMCSTSDP